MKWRQPWASKAKDWSHGAIPNSQKCHDILAAEVQQILEGLPGNGSGNGADVRPARPPRKKPPLPPRRDATNVIYPRCGGSGCFGTSFAPTEVCGRLRQPEASWLNPANQRDLFSHSIASSGFPKTLTIIPLFTATVSPNLVLSRRGSCRTYANRGTILCSTSIL